MQVTTKEPRSDQELVRIGVQKIARDFAVSLDEVISSDRAGAAIRARRDEALGIEAPHDEACEPKSLSFKELPVWQQFDVIRKTAAKYNVRSDYPGEVVGLFNLIASRYYKGIVSFEDI
jgi:hypothetical protein